MGGEDGAGSLQWNELREEGNKAFKRGAFDDAVLHYTRAIEINPQEASLFSNRSAAHIKRGAFKEAGQDAEAALAIDNTFTKAYSRLHNALCNQGRFEEAAKKLKNGIEVLETSGVSKEDIKHIHALQLGAEEGGRAVEAGRLRLEERDFAAAGCTLEATARSFPDCATVAFMIAEARASQRPDEVNSLLMKFSATHGQDPSYWYVRALVNYYRGQDGFKAAQTILRQTLEMDPDNRKASALLKRLRVIESLKEKGNTAYKEKHYRDAIEAYSGAIDADPTNVRVIATLRANRAAAKIELREYSDALPDCDFAINNGADSAKLYARRGRIHEALSNYDDALRDIQKASEMDGSYHADLRRIKASAQRAKRKDYYKILGLSANESDDAQIKRAYKKACLQWHPDKWADATEEKKVHAERMFKEVGEAFSILSDPQKKRMYDSGMLDNATEGGGASGFSGFSGQHDELMGMMNRMFFGNSDAGRFSGMPGGFSNCTRSQGRCQPGFTFKFF